MSKNRREDRNRVDFQPRGEVYPSPSDWRDQFIYHLMVDRFNDGDEKRPAYEESLPRDRDDSEGDRWQGGTLKGVSKKMDYIKGLGCTAIWLSPIFRNRDGENTYHGYGTQNFLEVDPRFGTVKDLQDLVKKAHKKGIRVILDVVMNHTGDNWAYPGGYPYYYCDGQRFDFGFWRRSDTPEEGDGGSVLPREFENPEWYRRKGEIRNWDAFPETRDGDFLSLKDLDTSNKEVLKALIDVYKHWIAEADIDGYRLDAAKHLEESSTAIFCNAIREYAQRIGKKNFFLFGEIVGEDSFIDQYIGRNARIPGTNERFPSLDAALDFPLWGVLEWVIKGFRNPAALRERYARFSDIYADRGEAGRRFVTFVDNHDQIGRSPKGRFLFEDPHQDQALLAVGYLLTSQGIPCIYYGTEQGFDGGGDHDKYLRECMFGGGWGAFKTTGHHFFNPEHPLYRSISRIAEIRKREPALRYGRQYFREVSGDGRNFGHPIDGRCTLAYSRVLDDTEILVAMNLDCEPREEYVTVDRNLTPEGGKMEDLLRPGDSFSVLSAGGADGGERHAVCVPLAGRSMAILKLIP
ncbi:alpha-amylase family glycosyl hydrolase [Methanotrichaceae archaeon M04Ac]|jgi:glycosidase|uniref:Alpha-amylase family glycosyl hydrolase n=1 Tax=Candidatus Methanocrinis alkalitolerans TaxID=3033395 RepID=A0ABT5XFR5_9EURY|nr:alpha-amylase family glycosyl hydrolase [Candidatus Methanocrinis alkalitolerans]MDF0593558.1 alpha-amylase family glycosyl hydrolase [Candidatus Methanocrinis alkalitolerans]